MLILWSLCHTAIMKSDHRLKEVCIMAKKNKTNPRKRVVTAADINKAEKKAKEQLEIITIVVAAMAAHDEFDFGPKWIERLVDNMFRKFNDWDAGYFSVKDALEWFELYTGMKIRKG